MKTLSYLILISFTAFAACKPKTTAEANEATAPVETTINESAQTFTAGKNPVTFESEGETLKGNLYLPQEYKQGDKLPVIIVGGSWTTVKEQMAGLYAEKLAQKGMAALAFDHRYYGESSGEPRYLEDPETKTEDFMNAMDYLYNLDLTDKSKTGGMAICASGGYMAGAVAKDDRFKSFAAVVPWFNTEEITQAFYGGSEGIRDRIDKSRAAEKQYKNEGTMPYVATISKDDPSAAMVGDFAYYLQEDLGNVPNWSDDKFALASWEPWLTYRPVKFAENISVPVLIVTSKNAATPGPSEEFYNHLRGPKDLVWLEGGQLDFYYKPEQVDMAIAEVEKHFTQTLMAGS